MAVQNPIGVALAGLLSLPGPLRVRGLYRTIIFLPTTLSAVIVGFPWKSRKHRGRHGADCWRLGRPFGLLAGLLKPGAAVTSKFAPSTNAPPRATS